MSQRLARHNAAQRGTRHPRTHLGDVALGLIVGLVCVAILMLFAAQAR